MPAHVSQHGLFPREYQSVPVGPTAPTGAFGRMFPELSPQDVPDAALEALGLAMKETEDTPSGDNPGVPAGFTYLGQFIDHDITFDPTTIPEMRVDPTRIFNFRTPKLELDCVYGSGPGVSRYLYEATPGTNTRANLVIGRTQPSSNERLQERHHRRTVMPNDLPRLNKVAVIGDPRNDENLAVAQTHLAFLKFHNKIVERIKGHVPEHRLFEEARKLTTWHYQKIVLTDFLPKMIRPDVLEDVLRNGRRFYCTGQVEPFIPIEFSVAAYRLGHSMVRASYQWNAVFQDPSEGALPANFGLLFLFSELQGKAGDLDIPVPSNWPIDWRRFYEFGSDVSVNMARMFDPFLTEALHDLRPRPLAQDAGEPEANHSLAVLNLKRGQRMGLPSGQAVAARMELDVLTPERLAEGSDGKVAEAHGLHRESPLWYYILKEAKVQEDGLRLGQVGSRILAEVFVGLLEGDANSFLRQDRRWKATVFKDPDHPPTDGYTMVDMLTFVDDLDPVGPNPG